MCDLSLSQVVTKKRVKLAKRFKCPFCANEDTVECKMDFKAGIGSLSCRLCSASFQMPIHHLHEPIDVFSEWLDDCEAAQNPARQQPADDAAAAAAPRYQDDDDDELPESSGLGDKKKKASANPPAAEGRQTYRDLGDSEDDDDDDE